MAYSELMTLEVRTTGSDTNGGGFVTGASGTDWSQQNGAQYAVTDAVTNGTTTVTSATASFGTDVVGNMVYIAGGSGGLAADWYEIVSRTDASTIVVDRVIAASTAATLNIGGALASPGLAATLMTVNNMFMWIAAGTYNITTATLGAGGPFHLPTNSFVVQGYDSARGDRTGTRPLVKWTGSAPGAVTPIAKALSTASAGSLFSNIDVDANSTQNVVGFDINQSSLAQYCDAHNVNYGTSSTYKGFTMNAEAMAFHCRAINCSYGFYGGSRRTKTRSCTAVGGAVGFYLVESVCCLSRDTSSHGFQVNTAAMYVTRCTAVNPGGDGFYGTWSDCAVVECLAVGSTGGYGFNLTANRGLLIRCADYGNSSGRTGGSLADIDAIILTANPFVNEAADDYRLNTTAGGGAELRNAGYGVPTQTDNVDIGAVQHTDPAGGSGGISRARIFAMS